MFTSRRLHLAAHGVNTMLCTVEAQMTEHQKPHYHNLTDKGHTSTE